MSFTSSPALRAETTMSCEHVGLHPSSLLSHKRHHVVMPWPVPPQPGPIVTPWEPVSASPLFHVKQGDLTARIFLPTKDGESGAL